MTAEITEDARRMAASIAAGFDQALQFTPQISVDSMVIVAANSPVLELVTLQKQALVRHRWSHSWLYSTKKLRNRSDFYSPSRPRFKGSDSDQHRSTNPLCQCGSSSPPNFFLLEWVTCASFRMKMASGNKLTAEDREQAFRALDEKARETFAKSNLLAEARLEAEKRIRELIDSSAWSGISTPEPIEKR